MILSTVQWWLLKYVNSISIKVLRTPSHNLPTLRVVMVTQAKVWGVHFCPRPTCMCLPLQSEIRGLLCFAGMSRLMATWQWCPSRKFMRHRATSLQMSFALSFPNSPWSSVCLESPLWEDGNTHRGNDFGSQFLKNNLVKGRWRRKKWLLVGCKYTTELFSFSTTN